MFNEDIIKPKTWAHIYKFRHLNYNCFIVSHWVFTFQVATMIYDVATYHDNCMFT